MEFQFFEDFLTSLGVSLVAANNIDYIDNDVGFVRAQRESDCNANFLAQCHICSPAFAKRRISGIRDGNVDRSIIVGCYEKGDFEELIALGANRMIPEMPEGSLIIGAQVLSFPGLDKVEINRQLNALRQPDNFH